MVFCAFQCLLVRDWTREILEQWLRFWGAGAKKFWKPATNQHAHLSLSLFLKMWDFPLHPHIDLYWGDHTIHVSFPTGGMRLRCNETWMFTVQKKRRARAGAGGELQRNKAIGIIDRYVIQYLFCWRVKDITRAHNSEFLIAFEMKLIILNPWISQVSEIRWHLVLLGSTADIHRKGGRGRWGCRRGAEARRRRWGWEIASWFVCTVLDSKDSYW